MSQSDSVDPWSVFLTNAQPSATQYGDTSLTGPAHGAGLGLTPRSLDLLRTLVGSTPTPVDELRQRLGLSSLQIAQEVILLSAQGLIEVRSSGGEDVVQLTENGAAFVAGPSD